MAWHTIISHASQVLCAPIEFDVVVATERKDLFTVPWCNLATSLNSQIHTNLGRRTMAHTEGVFLLHMWSKSSIPFHGEKLWNLLRKTDFHTKKGGLDCPILQAVNDRPAQIFEFPSFKAFQIQTKCQQSLKVNKKLVKYRVRAWTEELQSQ